MVFSLKCNQKYRNIKTKIICLLMCFLIMTTTIYMQYQEAQALVPLVIAGVALAPEAMAAFGTFLTACGVYFLNADHINQAVCDFYNETAPVIREGLINAYNSASDGVMTISDEIWNWGKSWTDENFNIGTNTVQVEASYFTEPSSGITYPITSDAWQTIQGYPLSFPISITNPVDNAIHTWDVTYESYDSSTDRVRILNNSDIVSTFYILKGTKISVELIYSRYTGTVTEYYLNRIGGKLITSSGSLSFWGQDLAYPYGQSKYAPWALNVSQNTLQATGDSSIVDMPGYDFKTAEGRRDVSIAATTADLVGKTATDVQNPTSQPPPITYPGSWTGTWRDGVPTGEWTFTGTGTYTGTMGYTNIGTWSGEWTTSSTGVKTWTGTYTETDATTWTGTATETPTNWDYPKWRIPADVIKNKFPFCIPWDLKRAIESLSATPEAPKWTINFDSEYFTGGGTIEIDFAQFETWAKIVRWGVLIIFNITLILITRKIIGAGGG